MNFKDRTTSWMSLLLVTFSSLGGLSCQPLDRELVILLSDEVDELADRLEVFVLDGEQPCSQLLLQTDQLDFPDAIARVAGPVSQPPQLGHVDDGRYNLLARVWSEDCRLAQACQSFRVGPDDEENVDLEIQTFLDDETICPLDHRCQSGVCLPCNGCCLDSECNDQDPITTDYCDNGTCGIDDDFDLDGVTAPQDCDDRDDQIYPGALPSCDLASDSDCDGVLDNLDGCATPVCWLARLSETQRLPQLRSRDIVVAGGHVYVAADEDDGGSKLWVGRLSGDQLEELGSVHLSGTEGGFRPVDLEVIGQRAYILTNDSEQIFVVDVSEPTAPVELTPFDLDEPRVTTAITIAPPLLWVTRSEGIDVFDITQHTPENGWPHQITTRISPLSVLISFELAFRHGTFFHLARTSGISCAIAPSSYHIPESSEFTSCFSATSFPSVPNALFTDIFVTPERELVLASATGGVAPDSTPPLLWIVPLDDEGLPTVEGTQVALTEGEPQALTVAGGTIFRSTNQGLAIHSRFNFAAENTVWFDADENADTLGPTVRQTAIIDQTAILAAESEGTILLHLECAR